MRGLRIENAKMDASLGGRFLLHMREREKISRGISKGPEQRKKEVDWIWPVVMVKDKSMQESMKNQEKIKG